VVAFLLRARRHSGSAGIYALVGEVGAVVGGAIWSAFLCAFVLAIFTATSYAELVTKYPRAGGSATYVNNAFKNSFVGLMVAFAVAAASLTSASVLSLAFSGDYLLQFISAPSVLAALVFVVIIRFINFYGISESVRLNLAFTCVEITGLLLIVLIGIVTLGSGTGEPARAFEFKEGVNLLPAILTGTVLAFYALIGFDDAVNVAEEVRHPSRIYPRATFGAFSPPASSTRSSPSPPRWWCRRASSPGLADPCLRWSREARSRPRPCYSPASRSSRSPTGLLST
jgi:APA family basic amino acid/polyamine antiporter